MSFETSNLIAAVEETWRKIQEYQPELPEVVFCIASSKKTLGHFAKKTWKLDDEKILDEVFIGGEGLHRGPEELLVTVLHEAAHALANARGVKDTSANNRYHNIKFKNISEELGLETKKGMGGIGWAVSSLMDGTLDQYKAEFAALEEALKVFRLTKINDKEVKKQKKLICDCGEDRKISASKKVLALGAITCSVCGVDFDWEPDE